MDRHLDASNGGLCAFRDHDVEALESHGEFGREQFVGQSRFVAEEPAIDDEPIDIGRIVEVLAGGNYKIKVSENHEVLARLNGKMRQYRIRVIQGDRVTVGVSPYDLKRGLITYRAK